MDNKLTKDTLEKNESQNDTGFSDFPAKIKEELIEGSNLSGENSEIKNNQDLEIISRRKRRLELLESIQKQKRKTNNHFDSSTEKLSNNINSSIQNHSTANSETIEENFEITSNNNTVEDKYSSDLDDMFSLDDSDEEVNSNNKTEKKIPIKSSGKKFDASLLDNWDDSEGYYRIISGEILNERYLVKSTVGRGVFSTVVRAEDVSSNSNNNLVAIKIVRHNETMYKIGQKEGEILKKLSNSSKNSYIIKYYGEFVHKSHLCLVFESMSMNLREVLRTYGRDVGLNLNAVKIYAKQLFYGLAHLKKCKIIHADIKPDNILVNEPRTHVKISDLGSAWDTESESSDEIAPYLVSRFYRAPELILGCPYDFSIDVWSVGCTLYELATGKILFPGSNNNEMLQLMMEAKGKISHKLLKRGELVSNHFDQNLDFLSTTQVDSVTGKPIIKKIQFLKPIMDIRSKLLNYSSNDSIDSKMMIAFSNLLDKCLNLNPEKRISPELALQSSFLVNDWGS